MHQRRRRRGDGARALALVDAVARDEGAERPRSGDAVRRQAAERWNRRSARAVAASKRPSIRLPAARSDGAGTRATRRPSPRGRGRACAVRGAASRAARARNGSRDPPSLSPGSRFAAAGAARRPGQRPRDPVHGATVEPLCAQADLERRDLRVRRRLAHPRARECHRRGEDDRDQIPHGMTVLRRPRGQPSPNARDGDSSAGSGLQFRCAAFPGSSIGRASGC